MGKDLIDSLVLYSGLPEDYFRKKLSKLIVSHGLNTENVSLNDIREIVVNLLQDIILNDTSDEC